MRTNIVLDDELVMEGLALSQIKTKRELVARALEEFVENRKRRDLRQLKGAGGLIEGYDYKELRGSTGGQDSCT